MKQGRFAKLHPAIRQLGQGMTEFIPVRERLLVDCLLLGLYYTGQFRIFPFFTYGGYMSLSIYDQFKQLTPQEQQYIKTHPHHTLAIKKSKELKNQKNWRLKRRKNVLDSMVEMTSQMRFAIVYGLPYWCAKSVIWGRFSSLQPMNHRYLIQRTKRRWISITTEWVLQ
ncbi:MAG: hypothetical protein LBU76_00330 [Azoarcus sp.]|jgi:hypothetical protein|nr:hypothetical protein [Azoarcus sp.]